ncbi:MAG: glycosyltransferase family 2 protein [Bacteroidaceae bacterium]|nr:glycosyltransferase family 2 protein [Bacteroidaceae bacterium]
MTITIFTPTYNRAHLLPRLYESLCGQTNKDFEWLIVDDGSSDNTEEVVRDFSNEKVLDIRYIKKPNGGKHTAINIGAQEAKGEMFFIVDSDDTLIAEATDLITAEWSKVRDKGLCGMSFLRGAYVDGRLQSRKESMFPKDRFIGNFIDVKYNHGSSADNAEVWVTECLRRHPFNVYEGERFMSEGMVWIRLAKEHDMLFVNRIIYICEYLEGGLTNQGKKLRFLCPKGGIEGSLETMSEHFNMKMRIKQTLLYIVYSKFDKRGLFDLFKCQYKGLVALCLPAGYAIYYHWKRKYFGNE